MTIYAKDIMTKQVVITRPDANVADVAKLMNKFRIGGLPVVDDGKLVGIITERCIMRNVTAMDKLPSEGLVKQVMIPAPLITVSPHEELSAIAQKISTADVTRLPVIDSGKLVGMVTNRDVLKASNEYLDLIIEQARIKGPLKEQMYVAFGACDNCGTCTNLLFKNNKFLCDDCV